MSQNAVVRRVVKDGLVEITLMRQMECGLSCNGSGSCESCGMRPKDDLLATARDEIGTQMGDFVEVESAAGSAISISLLVFVLPCVIMVLGYLLGRSVLLLSEGLSLLTALVGLLIGFLPAILYNRSFSRSQSAEFVILRKLRWEA